MSVVVCFLVFIAMVVGCLILGYNVTWAILGGVLLFAGVALSRGNSLKQVWQMAWAQGKKSLIVVRILILIGVITGLWRASGTIAVCVYYGIKIITPNLFLLVAFLMTCLLSYALGTSFGVVSTAGVIFMVLARFGGVNEIVAAGALLSGIYFGDRCSPAASSASLVAAVTDTDLYDNVKLMMRTGALPALLTTAVYAFLSFHYPLEQVDPGVMEALSSTFQLSVWTLLPAVVIVVLPLMRVPIWMTMVGSIAAAGVLAVALQGFSLWEAVEMGIFGYHPETGALAEALSGGGVLSMLKSLILVPLTGLYTGILDGIGALTPLIEKAKGFTVRFGRLVVTAVTSVFCSAVFCNQTIAVMLTQQIMAESYTDKRELAQDIENTAILFAGIVPWSIACSIPLDTLGVGVAAVPWGVLLWMIPLCYLFTKKRYFKEAGI